MDRRIEGSIDMRSFFLAAALAGAGLILPTAASAAAFAPARGAMSDQAGSAVIQVQQRQFRNAPRAVARPAVRAAPNRAFRQGGPNRAIQRQVGPGRAVGRPGGPGRAFAPGRAGPGRAFAPGRGVGPGRAAVLHRRGFRPRGYVRWHPRHLAYHRWSYRPYYGRIIGGVAIGTLLAASAYYAYAAEPPAPGLCWFWADPDETEGYWDYCVDPG
jgi:hypothetical protein